MTEKIKSPPRKTLRVLKASAKRSPQAPDLAATRESCATQTQTASLAGARSQRKTAPTPSWLPLEPGQPRTPKPKTFADQPLRLSKLMAERGLCSRREADEYIAHGWVKVAGQVVNTLGLKVLPHVDIELLPAAQRTQAERVTILLHKPLGYVSGQAEDGYQPASVLVHPETRYTRPGQIERPFKRADLYQLAPAGRLDIDSTGLLVLTQDGRIARQLIDADSIVEKEYLVRVQGQLSEAGLGLLNHGLSLDGLQLKPAKVSWQNEEQLRFILIEGRKRQIRRMCELVGLQVLGLKRVRIGKIRLGDLPLGQWRYLGADEAF